MTAIQRGVMDEAKWVRWSAISGFASLVVGAVGGALERGWPSATDPLAVAAFMERNRIEILAQSLLFVVSAGLLLWFLAGLRSFLLATEGGTGPLSTLMFANGAIWVGLSMTAQSFQVGNTLVPSSAHPASLATMAAMFSMANFPLALMLMCSAAVSLRSKALPVWLGWLSVAGAVAQLALWFGTVVQTGPLAPNGWLTYVLYPFFAVWLAPTSFVMMRRTGKPSALGESTQNSA